MKTIPYTKIENAEIGDIGKTCLMGLGCNPLAIEDTLDECIRVAEECIGDSIDRDDIDANTDPCYLMQGDLVAVIVGPNEEIETAVEERR